MMLISGGSTSAQTVKVGIINTYSGPLESQGDQMERGIVLYMKQHAHDLPAGVKIELVRRDDTGPNPEVAKRLAQDLITRDHVQLLAGVVWTPNALAIAPLVTEAKVPLIIMNAATASITTKSPYIVRVSLSLWQSSYPLGSWAVKDGIKRVFTIVSDYGPGIDSEQAFSKGFTDAGGQIAGSVRTPVANPDFVPFMQRAKDAAPDAVFAFVPGGKESTALMKTFSELGMRQAGVKMLGPGSLTTDEELQNMGDAALGVVTMNHYSAAATRPANQAFVKAYKAEFGAKEEPGYTVVDAYDGMAAIFHVVAIQNGKIDPDQTMALLKGWKDDESPRGPFMIDPATRDVVQNEYIRRVEKVNGELENVEFETIPMVKDPWKAINHQQ
ncbi:MAG TPA: ABC transporter substrate-binding protein [Acetobacteraceae bacterium]|nr:ABC transporter substrate-binding protein [Acetobacteraceae bacterium]